MDTSGNNKLAYSVKEFVAPTGMSKSLIYELLVDQKLPADGSTV
jgi:predicted DNA-binding transcriptional regulator AlpA